MNRQEEKNTNANTNPSKAMDSKQEVDKANDEKIDQDFPGYPHYPAKEDIMDQRTDTHRVDADVEQFAAGPNASGLNRRFVDNQEKQTGHPDDTRSSDSPTSARNDEIGIPQNVSNEDADNKRPGTDLEEANDQ